MGNSWKGVFYILGIIAAIYILIKYILPLLIGTLSIILNIAMWVAIIFFVVILIAYIAKMLKNR
jgi:hypothetical protein